MNVSQPIRLLLQGKPVFFPGPSSKRKHKYPNLVDERGRHWLLSNPVAEAADFSEYTSHMEACGAEMGGSLI